MIKFSKDFYRWCKDHTPALLVLNVALICTLWWNFSYHRQAKVYAEIYDISRTAYAPQSITLEELLFHRIKKTNPKLTDEKVNKYVSWIVEYAPQNGLDPILVVGVISTESFWNERLISTANCIGLMQVNYKVWKKELRVLGIESEEDLYNPEKNIQAGCYILGFYMAKFKGDTVKALQGYLGSQRAIWYSQRVGLYSIK